MAVVLQNFSCPPELINSVEDHVHILFDLGRTVAVSSAVEEVKKSSSKWIKTQPVGLGRPFRAGKSIAGMFPGRCPGLSVGLPLWGA